MVHYIELSDEDLDNEIWAMTILLRDARQERGIHYNYNFLSDERALNELLEEKERRKLENI